MSTKIRAAISEKNPYFISKHRYYELKHFCLQYPEWKHMRDSYDGYRSIDISSDRSVTEAQAIARAYYSERIDMVELAAFETAPEIASAIIAGVSEGVSFDILSARSEVPCGKDYYYEAYRRFFWILDKKRK